MQNYRLLRTLTFRRRSLLAVVVLGLTLVSVVPMGRLIFENGWSPLRFSFYCLFVILQLQIAFGFAGALTGWFLLRFAKDAMRIEQTSTSPDPKSLPPVAIVMPIYNEDSQRIFQGLKVMYESLEQQGCADRFDFFVLSDTSDLNCWIEEERSWFELCKQVRGFGKIFYRKRRVQLHNKSGNIADFCRRWGAHYRYMIVLDADSIMTGESFVRLTALMEQNPRVGIIQTSPRPVLGRSLFQRIEQFAAFAYRRLFAAGANYWQLGDATFWGHNAILRLRPFMEYCAMPELPEVGPLGKRILSHDTIEAALMRRAGYQVWQAYELAGSYEESPPHLLASLQRDRRWCHGNLQHLWFLFERRIKAVSRFNIFSGIMAYGSAPLWLGSLILGLVLAWSANGTRLPAGLNRPGLMAVLVYLYVLFLLLFPKVLGVALLMRSRESSKLCGGGAKIGLNVLLETVHSILMAPILMLFYTRFVFASFSGSEVKWSTQIRSDAEGPAWSSWLATHGINLIVILVSTGLLLWLMPAAIAWLLPVLLGPLVAIPLSRFTASVKSGEKAREHGLFLIPEEVNAPAELRHLEELPPAAENFLRESRDYASEYGLLQAILDPYINAIHVSLLRLRSESSVRTREHMTTLGARLLQQGPLAMKTEEKRMLLWDAESMLALHQKLWASPASVLSPWWQTAFRHYVESNTLSMRRRAVHV